MPTKLFGETIGARRDNALVLEAHPLAVELYASIADVKKILEAERRATPPPVSTIERNLATDRIGPALVHQTEMHDQNRAVSVGQTAVAPVPGMGNPNQGFVNPAEVNLAQAAQRLVEQQKDTNNQFTSGNEFIQPAQVQANVNNAPIAQRPVEYLKDTDSQSTSVNQFNQPTSASAEVNTAQMVQQQIEVSDYNQSAKVDQFVGTMPVPAPSEVTVGQAVIPAAQIRNQLQGFDQQVQPIEKDMPMLSQLEYIAKLTSEATMEGIRGGVN